MKNEMTYRSYCGEEPYILLKYWESDDKIATDIVNLLIEQQFRVSYSGRDAAAVEEADRLADRMLSAELIVFLISAEALESLAFRNAIHYALSQEKKLFCIYLDDIPLSHGLALQLSGVPGARFGEYNGADELCRSIVTNAPFTQCLRGEDAKVKADNNRSKKITFVVALVAMVALFAAGVGIAGYRTYYENTLPGQLERITETDYLDLSGENAALLEQLEGKTVHVLIARDMGLTDVDALETVRCEVLDLSQNPDVSTLEPLLKNSSLQLVTVSQDMYPAIGRISGRHSFRIVIGE